MRRSALTESQIWLPGTLLCEWQEAAGRRWHKAVVLKDMGKGFFEVDVEGMGRRVGTIDRESDYPGYIRPAKRKRKR